MVAINECRQPSTTHFVDVYEVMVDRNSILKNGIYTYNGLPDKCQGHRYKVLDFVTDVPSYQHKVLVECLSGPDKGLKFVCSLDNFNRRYHLEEQPHQPPEDTPSQLDGPTAGRYTHGDNPW